ncbi:DUF4836 family protein [Microbacter margulisiae]|uniref:Lipoprotein n=1 Tax=Microbacter margulisiae TaxID=1350067 RepID=A0A7W5DTK6_9PORP|nr:DUF4836 family protein [Microbacter margulisiae]MBB3188334.1 hypothetical protein [Microbacter margulisiae]
MFQTYKSHYFKAIAMVAILGLFLSSCSREKYPESLTIIPANASLVASINMKQLVDKAALSSFKNLPSIAMITHGGPGGEPMLKTLIDHPEKSGIDFKTMFVFLLPPNQTGISFPLHSASSFEKAVVAIGKEGYYPVAIQKASKCKYIFFSAQDSMVLVWDHHKALILIHSSPQLALAVFATPVANNILTNRDFVRFYQNQKDIACWINLNEFHQCSFLPKETLDTPFTSKKYLHAYLSFDKGSIDGHLDFVTNNDSVVRHSIAKQPEDSSFMSYLPANSLLIAKLSVLPEIAFPYLAAVNESSSSYQQFLHAWSGDAALSFFGFANSDFPIPQMVLLATLRDRKGYDVLLNELLQHFQKRSMGGYTVVSIQPFTLYTALVGQTMMVTTNQIMIRDFVANRACDNPVQSTAWNGAIHDPLFLYVNLDLQKYPAALADFLSNFGISSFDAVKQNFIFKDLQVSYNPSTNRASCELRLKDTTQNSLHVILQKANEAIGSTN